jgi:hypothetical protein
VVPDAGHTVREEEVSGMDVRGLWYGKRMVRAREKYEKVKAQVREEYEKAKAKVR